ncbi:MAG TPA: hypothetical protein VGH85_00475 [Mycobacteriales bacterium]|jgi:hypothetical protein
MTEPEDRPDDRNAAEHREPPTENPQQEGESRLDHIDPDTQNTPDKVKRERDRD